MDGKNMKEKRKDKKVRIEKKDRKVCLEPKFFHYKDKKIPILQYQKAGHQKIFMELFLDIRECLKEFIKKRN